MKVIVSYYEYMNGYGFMQILYKWGGFEEGLKRKRDHRTQFYNMYPFVLH